MSGVCLVLLLNLLTKISAHETWNFVSVLYFSRILMQVNRAEKFTETSYPKMGCEPPLFQNLLITLICN